ncbi:ATP-binding cassette domain-containing protein [Ornithinimicrobium flavum]|uniref:ATP-binding cassette domain-containing protein n=1 Tax=Ornithinimicrobium flavum TaxID=1288636 RepID=UPI003B836470
MSLLEVTDVRSGYGRIEALHGVSLHVDEGEAVTIIGSNGAGKTTLLKTIAGHLRPTAGRVVLAGQDITTWSPEKRTRAGIGLVRRAARSSRPAGHRPPVARRLHASARREGPRRRRPHARPLPHPARAVQQLAGTLSAASSN